MAILIRLSAWLAAFFSAVPQQRDRVRRLASNLAALKLRGNQADLTIPWRRRLISP
jgi:hypothetical protein